MTNLLPVLIIGWLAVAYVLFRKLPGAWAVLIVVIVGQLFLPEIVANPTEPGAPPALALPVLKFTKANTIGYALLFGSLLTDWRRWCAVRPQWYDLPMALWCISAIFPAVNNGIGPAGGFYEGGNLVLNQVISWGVPYWCGRLYLGSLPGLRAAAAAIVLGGMIYAPFVLFEWRMSPQLHHIVYGYHQHDFVQTVREGGYRPMVFMEHGLMVSLWMATAALTAYWLWREQTFRVVGLHRSLPAIGLGWVALGLGGVLMLMHSVGAVVLAFAGLVVLEVTRRSRSVMPMMILILLPPLYVAARYTDLSDGQDVVALVREWNEERAQSLDFRFKNEYKLLNRAKEQPLFGWGDSGAARMVEGSTREKVVTDSMWIITVGNRGLFGLMTFLAAMMIPVLRFLRYHPPRLWLGPFDAPAAVLAVALSLYLLDHMVNAMVNPIFTLVSGGLAGAAAYLNPLPVEEWPISVRDT